MWILMYIKNIPDSLISYILIDPGTWKVRTCTSAWYSLHVDATRQNMILPDLPVALVDVLNILHVGAVQTDAPICAL
jgi:hypothetical protein